MLRRVFAGVLAGGLLLLFGGTAVAASPETNTTTQRNLVETFVDVVPSCEAGGPAYQITTTSNAIEHETVFADGRIHATFTETGTFVAVPLEDPSLPSFTGSFSVRGGFNQENEVVVGTFTFSERGKGSDGPQFTFHTTGHFNVRPDGTVNDFFRCR
jgi:hypothetical protein